MLPELAMMRSVVASSAGSEMDPVSHRAYLYQAESLTDMFLQVSNVWFDVELEMRQSTYGEADEEVELVYAERLARWMRSHAGYVARVAAGGEIDPDKVKAKWGQLDVYIAGHRLYAERHHEVVADYCERVASSLDARAEELRQSVS
jgi:hypothetical protein